ncbi:uncharacterized protein METZ01_LOCUS304069, partial [marine metagenome]
SPMKGVSGPNIIPKRRDTKTNGTSTLVSFFKKLVIPLKVKSKSIFS